MTGSDSDFQPVVGGQPGQRGLVICSKWCSAAAASPASAARQPCAHRLVSCINTPRIPAGSPVADAIQFGQQPVAGIVAAPRGEQRQLRQRHRGQGMLPGAAGQLHRLGGMGHRAGPVPGRDIGERQSRQREQHQADRPVIAGLGQHATEQPAEAVVIAEVEGGDPEIGQQVRLGQVLAEGDGLTQGLGCGGQAIVVELVEPGEQEGEALGSS